MRGRGAEGWRLGEATPPPPHTQGGGKGKKMSGG